MNRWTGISEFIAVVQTSSFTGAALKLDRSVVQVSRAVATLEERLQVKLLSRTTRNVSVTEAGQAFFARCEHLTESLDDAEQAVTNIQHTPAGQLNITAPVAYGERFIAPLVASFLQHYPDITVSLSLTNEQLDLRESNLDVAIRLGQLSDSTLIARRLASRTLFTCASPAYLNQSGMPATINALEQHSCLLGTMDFWRFEVAGKLQRLRLKGRLRCNSGRVLVEHARAGLGIVQLPDYYVAPLLETGELEELLAPFRVASEGIWAVVTEHKKMSIKVRLFVDYLQHHLSLS